MTTRPNIGSQRTSAWASAEAGLLVGKALVPGSTAQEVFNDGEISELGNGRVTVGQKSRSGKDRVIPIGN